MKKLFLLVIILIILASFGYWYSIKNLPIILNDLSQPNSPWDNLVADKQQPAAVIVDNDLSLPLTSPVTITGTALGTWYFEASFPVELYDSNNLLLASGVAQAQSDWMTVAPVAFSVTLNFPTPATTTGTLVLKKDNPSGEPANDASLILPVIF